MAINKKTEFEEIIVDIIRRNNSNHFHFKERVLINLQKLILHKTKESNIKIFDEIYLDNNTYKVFNEDLNKNYILELIK